ncbi:hypothetical protein ASC66_04425 [Leifsonia sp. Root4]|nr:hypothetical protein ASC66_04425 [Leifsonia sp. Root4]
MRAALPDDKRPDVELVRLVSLQEWPEAVAQCLRDAGWNATSEDGGVGLVGVTEAQREPSALAQYTCEAQYPVDPKYLSQLTDSQLEYLYVYYTTTLRDCLIDAGYTPSDPPSREKFIESYYRTGAWSPYSEVPVTAVADLDEKCPQVPEGLWG